jgi:hypothetical protein
LVRGDSLLVVQLRHVTKQRLIVGRSYAACLVHPAPQLDEDATPPLGAVLDANH